MRYLFIFAILFVILQSCSEAESTKNKKEIPATEGKSSIKENVPLDLSEKGETEIIDNLYIEYYPGEKKRIKFQGKQDVNKLRDGVWLHFSYEGTELSMTTFDHGKKAGPTMVKYPNGNIHYIGQYKNDKAVGVWTTYTIDGVSSDKDFGTSGE
jgi:antitoxin component YwqK of YwqJK toxin-antitoxin module